MSKPEKNIIVGITGSIAAYKACDIISAFRKDGHNVEVILTKEAEEFITALTMQTVSGNKVFRSIFELPGEWNPAHTSVADRAKLILIAPATANIIGKLAGGICDDMLTCVVYASACPVLIAPAMNEKMYRHKVTQENISKLKKIGYRFVGPIEGRLACGCVGIGHIAEVKDIVSGTKRLLV